MAKETGTITEEEAIVEAVQGALEAAQAIGPEAVARVEGSLPSEIVDLVTRSQMEDTNEDIAGSQ